MSATSIGCAGRTCASAPRCPNTASPTSTGCCAPFGVPLSRRSLPARPSGEAASDSPPLCWLLRGRIAEPHRTWAWHGFGAAYLMLFNPMTEANSYVIPPRPSRGRECPATAFAGGNRALGGAFAAMGLSMGLLPNLLRPLFGNAFALAWHPSMTLVFSVLILTALVLGGRSPLRVEPSPDARGGHEQRRRHVPRWPTPDCRW